MRDWIGELIQESCDQYRMVWELMARSSDAGSVTEDDELSFAISGLPVPMFNVAFLHRPPKSPEILLSLAARSVERFKKAGVSGMITLPSSWVPQGGKAAMEAAGLPAGFNVMGMRTARLNDPTRPSVEIRQIAGDEGAEIIARVNGEAYGMPEALWRTLILPRLWSGPSRAYAIFENSEPAAVGAAVTLQGICYVMWMATRHSSRGRGYAQAIIHRMWKDAREKDGTKLTVLHATAAGRPVYNKLGYTAVTEFPGFLWSA